MKTVYLLLCMAICSCQLFAQIQFENGYFISNNGRRTDCLIKNVDWKNNPVQFDYKLDANAAAKTAKLEDVSEFGVSNSLKYKRFDVDIDQSSDRIDQLSDTSLPQFERKRLFLKALVEGTASLYFYESSSIVRFFITTDKVKLEQLVFKRYMVSQSEFGENFTYRNQLWNYLKCPTITLASIERMPYQKDKLIKLVSAYNQCQHGGGQVYTESKKKKMIHLSVRPGLNFSGLRAVTAGLFSDIVFDFDNKTSLRMGLEGEFLMPFNKNKWAFLFELVYQSYKSAQSGSANMVSIDYRSIELNAGLRHYFFLNKDSRLFLNATILYALPMSSTFKYGATNLEVTSNSTATVGGGFKYKKFSAEMRYMLSRELLSKYVYWNSSFKTTSVILGYAIF